MELKSEPAYETVQVTDIDIAFPGDLQSHTLRDGVDTMVVDEASNMLTVTFGHGGSMQFNCNFAHWVAKKQRTIRVLVPAAQSATPTAGAPQPKTE